MQEGLDTLVLEAECGCTLLGDDAGTLNGVKAVLADKAVVADSLDVEQTSVGSKADLPECGKVVKPFADVEVAAVVNRSLCPEGAALLVVLLDPCALVIHVERGMHALGDDPCPKPPGWLWVPFA